MRTLDLLVVAVEAEALRLRREIGGLARGAAWGVAGAGFGAAALVMLHVAAWYWLLPHLGLPGSALAIALVDALVAALLVVLARPRNDPVAEEAARLRALSLQASRQASGLSDLLGAKPSPAGAVAGLLADAALAAWKRR
jgi:hypothetical protein